MTEPHSHLRYKPVPLILVAIIAATSVTAICCGDGDPGGTAGSGGSAGSGGTAGSGASGGAGASSGSGGIGLNGTVTDLTVETFIDDLNKPWDIAWLPNGTPLVTERPGRLNVYTNGPDASPVVIAPDDVVAEFEGGMMGLEVDPNFANNGYVFVCMASDMDGPVDVRVVRLTLETPNGGAVTARQDIVTGIAYNMAGQEGRHSGCRPRFGPDGNLWVGTGDAAVGTTPQDDNSLGGKVLRVDRNGAAANGNPGGRRWFSKGHRNIQGIAFRSDGLGVSAEHGPSVDDEINLLVEGNFGWDPVPIYNENVPMTDTDKFPDAVEAIWSTGSPTLALSGATFVEGARWADWDGRLVVATLKAQHLHLFTLDASNNVTDQGMVITNRGRLRSPRQGPDGLLYVTTDGAGTSGEVLRATPLVVIP